MIPIKTSEKMVEVNILHELAKCFEKDGRRVTIISPTQIDERDLGYDDWFDGLLPGKILALQFKGPKIKNTDYAEFKISIPQLGVLRQHFRVSNQAYYVFAPFPSVDEFIDANVSFRNPNTNILDNSSILDIQDNELDSFIGHYCSVMVKKSDPTEIMFTNGRVPINGAELASVLCEEFSRDEIGKPFDPRDRKKKDESIKNKQYKNNENRHKLYKTTGTYVIHISAKTNKNA